jgi:hypothetical protein
MDPMESAKTRRVNVAESLSLKLLALFYQYSLYIECRKADIRHRRFIAGSCPLALDNGNGSYVIEETLDFVSSLRRYIHIYGAPQKFYVEPKAR